MQPESTYTLSAQDNGQITRSYAAYYGSGHYEKRYPAPNPNMRRRILRHAKPEIHIIDYGCGSGRYLLGLQGRVRCAAGFDISVEALDLLRARAQQRGWENLTILGPSPKDLDEYLNTAGQADVVLCLFGVLAHITDAGERHDVLLRLRHALKPGHGRLLISVPNKARRFFAEQRASGGSRISYMRRLAGQEVPLAYQLFDQERLKRELSDAGFHLERIRAECVFPESAILTNPAARLLDQVLTPLCPARLGYGLYAEAMC